jgi:hypothetical protein
MTPLGEGVLFVGIMLGAVALWSSLAFALRWLEVRQRQRVTERRATSTSNWRKGRPIHEWATSVDGSVRATIYLPIGPEGADGNTPIIRADLHASGDTTATYAVWYRKSK